MTAHQEVTGAYPERVEAKIETGQKPMEAKIKTGMEEVKATDMEANPEEIQVVTERQKVTNEKAAVETVGALKDQSGDRSLAIRRRRRFTHHAAPALQKGRGHKGPGKMLGNGSRGRSRRRELDLGSKGTFYETLGQTIGLEIVKRTVGSSMRIQKTSVKTLWRSWPLPKQKRRWNTA
jgi:hypothetical protein